MTDDRQERPHLKVISEETPPPSEANDAIVVGSAIIAALAGVGFAVALALHTSIVVYGTALTIGLLALGFGVRRYFTAQYPDLEAVEPRHVDRPPDDPSSPISDVQPVARRSLMRGALIGAGGIFGLSLLAPVPSLGPAPGDALRRTAWRRGTRLVTTAGDPIRADAVELVFNGDEPVRVRRLRIGAPPSRLTTHSRRHHAPTIGRGDRLDQFVHRGWRADGLAGDTPKHAVSCLWLMSPPIPKI